MTDAAGAIVQMDTTKPEIYLIFTGHDHNEGRLHVLRSLTDKDVKASFFFTGDFYRNEENRAFIEALIRNGHYLGAHSDKHLLYADWTHRDSTLVSRDSFTADLKANYLTMKNLYGISRAQAPVFVPSYEWYNQDIVKWTTAWGLTLVNLTPGPGTARDYTWPQMGNRYVSAQTIIEELLAYERRHTLNGAIILIHLGTDERRADKLYDHLSDIVDALKGKGYQFGSF